MRPLNTHSSRGWPGPQCATWAHVFHACTHAFGRELLGLHPGCSGLAKGARQSFQRSKCAGSVSTFPPDLHSSPTRQRFAAQGLTFKPLVTSCYHLATQLTSRMASLCKSTPASRTVVGRRQATITCAWTKVATKADIASAGGRKVRHWGPWNAQRRSLVRVCGRPLTVF